MRLDILTLFPNMFQPLKESILSRAENKGLIQINIVNIRDFSLDAHKKCDDYPFGGGAGMVMTPQPIFDAIMSVKTSNSKVIYLSPKGKTLNQEIVVKYSLLEHVILLCGHYEGIDQRIIDLLVDEELSIGDYVLTGGEIPAMVFVDAVSRYVDGVINKESLFEESFSNNYLEYPQWTRPQVFKGVKVPDILLSGNHKEIEKWRQQQSIIITQQRRPDLLENKNEN